MARPGGGDRGGMLAVLAPIEAIEAVVRDEKLDLVLANRNSPRNRSVLSGPTAEVAPRRRGVRPREGSRPASLEVSAAFHSRLVADASGAAPRGPGARIEFGPGPTFPVHRQLHRRGLSGRSQSRPARSWPTSSRSPS